MNGAVSHIPGRILRGLDVWRIGGAPAVVGPAPEHGRTLPAERQPGRELDALVAEAVFGLRAQERAQSARRGERRTDSGPDDDSRPAFSTEWDAAAALMDALLKRDDVLSVAVHSGDAESGDEGSWDCSIVLVAAPARPIRAVAPTGPHAICLAALTALAATTAP